MKQPTGKYVRDQVRQRVTAKRQEERLAVAYDAGYFDGYHAGVEDTHEIWVEELLKMEEIQSSLYKVIMVHMAQAMKRRQLERQLDKNELSEEVKQYGE